MTALSAKTVILVMVASTLIMHSPTEAKPQTLEEISSDGEVDIVPLTSELILEGIISRYEENIITTFATPVFTLPYLQSEFFSAAAEGDVDGMEQILSESNNEIASSTPHPLLLERDSLGNTALHLAVNSGNQDAVDLLLRHGARSYAVGPNLQTPLHMAAGAGNTDIVNALIKYNDEYRSQKLYAKRDIFGNTSLGLAVYGGHIGVVNALAPKSDEDTLQEAIIVAMQKQNVDILYVLLNSTALVDWYTLKQSLNMVWDARSVWAILDALSDTDSSDLLSALTFASRAGRVAALRPLIAAGAAITRGLIDTIISEKQEDVLKELIRVEKNGSSPDVLTEYMRSYLKAKIIGAAKLGFLDRIKMLLEAGVDANAVLDGETPLIAAVKVGCQTCVSLLLDYGADPNLEVRVVDDPGSSKIKYYTPLSIADETGQSEIEEILISHGANTFV